MSAADPFWFSPSDLTSVASLTGRVADLVDSYGRRLVVTVYDSADSRPIAWIEKHPDDSDPKIVFVEDRSDE